MEQLLILSECLDALGPAREGKELTWMACLQVAYKERASVSDEEAVAYVSTFVKIAAKMVN